MLGVLRSRSPPVKDLWVFRQMSTRGSDFCPEGAAYNSPGSEERHPGVVTPTRTSSYPLRGCIADPLMFEHPVI